MLQSIGSQTVGHDLVIEQQKQSYFLIQPDGFVLLAKTETNKQNKEKHHLELQDNKFCLPSSMRTLSQSFSS